MLDDQKVWQKVASAKKKNINVTINSFLRALKRKWRKSFT